MYRDKINTLAISTALFTIESEEEKEKKKKQFIYRDRRGGSGIFGERGAGFETDMISGV